MLKNIALILVLLYASSLFAQEIRGFDGEIYPRTKNTGGSTYKFEIKPVSGKTTWCQSWPNWYIVTNATTSSQEIPGNRCIHNSYGFDKCGGQTYPNFWLTLNEFTIYKKLYGYYWDEIISFYIDYRDCRYGGPAGSRDITILIDGEDDEAYYAPGVGPNDCDLQYFTEISEGDTLKIWEVNDFSGSHDVSCMCATPTLDSLTNHYNKPKLTWSHADDPNGSYSYEVWRLLADNFFKEPMGTWYLINTVTDTSYIDNEIYLGDGT